MVSESDNLSDKIIRQVEYYFGDINLSKDKFMQEEITKDAGWVTIDTLCTFNRLKSLSTDHQVIIDALKQSTSNLLEVEEENKKIRRAKPLPENLGEFETQLKQNTVYVKGFPGNITLDELYGYFEQHGKVLQIFMRRFPATRQFKGSVFATFETNEQMKEFLEKDEVKYEDSVLSTESQEDYFKRKEPEIQKVRDAKAKKEQAKEDKIKQKQEAEEAFLREQKILGAILHIKGIGESGTRENLKEIFDNYATVKFVDYNKGQTEAYLRFAKEDGAKEALAKATEAGNGEIKHKDSKLEVRVLEGEEEEDYWKTIVTKLTNSRANRKNFSSNRRGKKNNNNYGRKNGNKRSLNEDNDSGDNDGENGNGNDGGEAQNNEQKGESEENAKKLKV